MLRGERVQLRALERGDLPTIVRWFNDPAVRRRLARVEPMSLAEEERWFDALLRATTEVVFGIDDDDGALVGTCGLHRIDWRNRQAALGIVIGDAADQGRGLGTDAVRTLLRHAFANLGLHRVEATVRPENAASRRVLAKVGFREEGLLQRYLHVDGAWRDHLLVAMTAEERDGSVAAELVRRGLARWA